MKIEFENVHKIYNNGTEYAVEALRGINLTVNDGECLAIMGVSGSGKSTLLNIIGFVDKPTEGKYLVDGKNSDTLDEYEMRNLHIGFVLQNYGILGHKTVYENVAYPLLVGSKVRFKDIKEQVNKTLKTVGIFELKDRKANHISGGQKQRVAIARALVTNPEIILADEPTAALDSSTANEIMALLIQLNKSGHTVIVVTHDKRVAEKCGKIIYISDGCISNEIKSEKGENMQ